VVKNGKYKHFKGNYYLVIGIARHSETEEELVVYKPLYGDGALWVRPLVNFTEKVNHQGKDVPRFEFVEEFEK
jgi:hypothetical protein